MVDAAQGVEAQTVANAYAAIDAGLELIPVLNKVDLPGADPDGVAAQVADLLGVDPAEALRISAKTGEGVTDVLEAIVQRIPPPDGEPEAPPRALIFDSEFDQYRGVVAYVRMMDGRFSKSEPIKAMQARIQADIDDIGFFTPKMTPAGGLSAGEVGYVITGIKDVTKLRVGDTLTSRERPATEALPGYREVRPMVFSVSSRSTPTATRTCVTHSTALRSTTPLSLTSPRPPRRSASVFAAASSVYCTWTSFVSGSSGNTTWSCSRPRPTCATRCGSAVASSSRCVRRPRCPTHR